MEKTVKKKNIPLPTNFGKNMRFLRRRQGLTQGAFAEIIGISRNSIASYENGSVEPSAFNFLRVSKYFDMDPQDMLEQDLHAIESDEFKSEEALNNYLQTSLDEFYMQTIEMSKVLEGYEEFYAMRKELLTDDKKNDFYLILDDLLSLLKSLIYENKMLISEIVEKE